MDLTEYYDFSGQLRDDHDVDYAGTFFEQAFAEWTGDCPGTLTTLARHGIMARVNLHIHEPINILADNGFLDIVTDENAIYRHQAIQYCPICGEDVVPFLETACDCRSSRILHSRICDNCINRPIFEKLSIKDKEKFLEKIAANDPYQSLILPVIAERQFNNNSMESFFKQCELEADFESANAAYGIVSEYVEGGIHVDYSDLYNMINSYSDAMRFYGSFTWSSTKTHGTYFNFDATYSSHMNNYRIMRMYNREDEITISESDTVDIITNELEGDFREITDEDLTRTTEVPEWI